MLINFDYLFSKYNVKATEVLHVGANKGQETDAYIRNGITRIDYIEALEHVFHKLSAIHFHEKYDNIISCFKACVSNVDGQEVTFNISNNEAQSSSFLEFGTHSKEHPTVEFIDKVKLITTRLDTFLDSNQIKRYRGGLLNLDIQGAELLALEGLGRYISEFDYIYCEVNKEELYKGCAMVWEIDEYLSKHGFIGVEEKWTNHSWGDKFYIRKSMI
jgi:FkbM family methyltransferase